MMNSEGSSFFGLVAEQGDMPHRDVAIEVVGFRAALSFVHKFRMLFESLLYGIEGTLASHPISWLLVWGVLHLSLGV